MNNNRTVNSSKIHSWEANGHVWKCFGQLKSFKSDLHTICPGNEVTHNHFLKVLGDVGFDIVLRSLSCHFGLKEIGIVTCNMLAISQCQGYKLHKDIRDCGGMGFLVLILVILVEHSKPELILADDKHESCPELTAAWKYELDKAIVLGEGAFHCTSPTHFQRFTRPPNQNEVRFMVAVILAEWCSTTWSMNNFKNNFAQFPGCFPPPNINKNWIAKQRGKHYSKRRGKHAVRLPKCGETKTNGTVLEFNG